MRVHRSTSNPLITPADVVPSRPDFRVVGVFNPAAIRHEEEVLLLLRVAEAEASTPEDDVAAPVFDARTGRIEIRRWRRDAAGVDTSDPRIITVHGRSWLTSISHLRLARSGDGVHFEIEPTPALVPGTTYEEFGIEDPRITRIGDTYWINYTAVSSLGIATALASTSDFRSFRRHGVIFPPDNRDVTIFPERIAGRYVALHRPMPNGIGEPAIWVASSDDLLAWGSHQLVATAREGEWDDLKIGGGAVPFRVRTDGVDGWLAIYHGVTRAPFAYSLGALLLDAHDPARVLARSREPLLAPEAPYERRGFLGDVVFTCGVLPDEATIRIYYGAADGVTALATVSLADVLAGMSPA